MTDKQRPDLDAMTRAADPTPAPQPSAAPRFTCLASVGPDLRGCGLVFGSWDELKAHEETHQPPAVQPERCCLDYPRCDCNSPPEPDDEVTK